MHRAGAIALALLAAAPAHAADQPGESTAKAILRDLLVLDTSGKHGTAAAVEVLRARFLAAGFAPADLAVVPWPADPTRVNLVVRLHGRDPQARALLYLCHLDVVPGDPADWSVPPYALTERDGWIYGRGSIDMKGEDANVAAALIRMKREGDVPARDVIAAFTADEEGAGEGGVAYLLSAHRDLVDAGIALNPDSGVAAMRQGRITSYSFQTSEKLYATFTARATNRGGHSSEPRPDNAIYQLTAALDRLAQYRFPARLIETVRAQYAALGALEQGPRKADMVAVGKGDIAAADRLSDDPLDNANLRTTCVVTQISGGHAENALPQSAEAKIQCRLIPGTSTDEVKAALERVIADPGVAITLTHPPRPAPESPPTPAIAATITRAVQSVWPGTPVMPDMDVGGSDSVLTRSAGIPSYGVPSLFDEVDDLRAHGRDERVSAVRFAEGTEFTWRLIKGFAAPGAPGSTK